AVLPCRRQPPSCCSVLAVEPVRREQPAQRVRPARTRRVPQPVALADNDHETAFLVDEITPRLRKRLAIRARRRHGHDTTMTRSAARSTVGSASGAPSFFWNPGADADTIEVGRPGRWC